jgi:hypothetical protein
MEGRDEVGALWRQISLAWERGQAPSAMGFVERVGGQVGLASGQ